MASYFVDPSIAANSGTGTLGDPYGDLQYALDTITKASTGDQINIKAGTAEVLTASLDRSSYGTPGFTSPLIFRGYTSSENDGGVGEISGNGSFGIYSGGGDCVYFVDLNLHNCGSADVLTLTRYSGAFRCEISDTTGDGIVLASQGYNRVCGCNVHDVGGRGIHGSGNEPNFVVNNYLKNGTNQFSAAIATIAYGVITRNIISVDGGSNGIDCEAGNNFATEVTHNTVFSDAGTGTGILVGGGAADALNMHIASNVVQGFSGSGGQGIDLNATTRPAVVEDNVVNDCATAYPANGLILAFTDNTTAASSVLSESGSDTFANRATYFAPVGDALDASSGLNLDRGAVQSASGSGISAKLINPDHLVY